jgi:hypothetical protein
VTDSQTQASIEALARLLRHYDPPQLLFQLAEVVGERTYLKHGIDVHEGDIVLDVGANVGVAAAFFASDCKAGLVHSFEPMAPLFELLRENAEDQARVRTYMMNAGAPGELADRELES